MFLYERKLFTECKIVYFPILSNKIGRKIIKFIRKNDLSLENVLLPNKFFLLTNESNYTKQKFDNMAFRVMNTNIAN